MGKHAEAGIRVGDLTCTKAIAQKRNERVEENCQFVFGRKHSCSWLCLKLDLCVSEQVTGAVASLDQQKGRVECNAVTTVGSKCSKLPGNRDE